MQSRASQPDNGLPAEDRPCTSCPNSACKHTHTLTQSHITLCYKSGKKLSVWQKKSEADEDDDIYKVLHRVKQVLLPEVNTVLPIKDFVCIAKFMEFEL